ncbi:MAG: cytochrome c3 family protein [Bacteroidetes bacterium]|nr:cytochrome c3 family protein [Bacteroidota bacterium]
MKTTFISIMLLSGLMLSSCSELQEEKVPTESTVSVHGKGFADASSANFHAAYVRNNKYDLTLCQSCHGNDFSGGTTGQSCNTCHNKPNGPENCTTCHGSVNAAPPNDLVGNSATTVRGVGAHQKHLLGGTLGAAVPCATCHVVPASLASAGHLDATPNAEVRFDTTSATYRSGASYAAANATCSNTYCHGNFNGGNGNVTMAWAGTGGSTSTACGTCHGDVTKATLKEKAFPVTGHTAASITSDCSTCHSRTVNASLAIIDPSKHMNGQVD